MFLILKSTLSTNRAVVWIANDNVNKFVAGVTVNIEIDLESEYLFRTHSVATNLVTSPKFIPLHCATMLCHFGQMRNSFVASNFILISSTATSSASCGYVVVPERFGRYEEPAGSNEERTTVKAGFFRKSSINRCSDFFDK